MDPSSDLDRDFHTFDNETLMHLHDVVEKEKQRGTFLDRSQFPETEEQKRYRFAEERAIVEQEEAKIYIPQNPLIEDSSPTTTKFHLLEFMQRAGIYDNWMNDESVKELQIIKEEFLAEKHFHMCSRIRNKHRSLPAERTKNLWDLEWKDLSNLFLESYNKMLQQRQGFDEGFGKLSYENIEQDEKLVDLIHQINALDPAADENLQIDVTGSFDQTFGEITTEEKEIDETKETENETGSQEQSKVRKYIKKKEETKKKRKKKIQF